jgi:hypothetical protein
MSQRLPKYHRAEGYPDVAIGRPKHLILVAIGIYHYLTAVQLARLLFSPGSLTYVRDQVKELFHSGHLARLFPPTLAPRGAYKAVYALDRRGYAYLKAQGLEPPGRFRPSENVEREWLFLRHTESANDLLILVNLLTRQDPQLELHRVLTERQLKHHPVYVTVDDKKVGVIPDGWVDLRRGNLQTCLAFELDRGTVSRKNWTRKVQALNAYSKGPYQDAAVFDTNSLSIAVVTTASERRLNDLIDWTEDAFEQTSGDDIVSSMFLAAFDPATIAPRQAFYSPIWSQPFSDQRLPLLDFEAAEG